MNWDHKVSNPVANQSINERKMGLGLEIEEAIIYSVLYYNNILRGKIPTKTTYVIEVKTSMWCQQAHLLQDVLTTSTHTLPWWMFRVCDEHFSICMRNQAVQGTLLWWLKWMFLKKLMIKLFHKNVYLELNWPFIQSGKRFILRWLNGTEHQCHISD